MTMTVYDSDGDGDDCLLLRWLAIVAWFLTVAAAAVVGRRQHQVPAISPLTFWREISQLTFWREALSFSKRRRAIFEIRLLSGKMPIILTPPKILQTPS